MKNRLLLTLLLAGGVALPGAAFAGGAYTSDKISVFEMPRYQTNEIIGLLPAREPVTIDRCTAAGDWCRVKVDHLIGWVPASYLVGSAAKNDVTPMLSLTAPSPDQASEGKHLSQQPGLF